ncbi:MAG: stage III sporulation protein AF [Bacteroidales bacterium]|nr:stage III sporulation protein AF [Clostridium sp.]MCM1202634.1 stage III sporulation protein AF [Bacteroidales bacterium]
MEEILAWVRSGLLFGIVASLVMMLSPNKAYQKHISLVVGLLFILVMVHPIMELFDLDSSTYLSYIRNFLMLETRQEEMSEENILLYEESVNAQLKTVLQEGGYPVENVSVRAEEDGRITEICLVFNKEVDELERLEHNLINLFGEDVRIRYEAQ